MISEAQDIAAQYLLSEHYGTADSSTLMRLHNRPENPVGSINNDFDDGTLIQHDVPSMFAPLRNHHSD
uniref:Uncharacterized protein n=1 Tax=Acrobeloides nanus TaxID=290746 RepID=A0A914C6D0_9BILA